MRPPFLLDFCASIESTSLSNWIQSQSWVIPTFQTIHLLGISAVLISILMINLRILGIGLKDHPLIFVLSRFTPVINLAFIFLVMSGLVMIIGEPARSLANSAFQFKMLCLLIVLFIMMIISKAMSEDSQYWQKSNKRQFNLKLLALISLALWVSIVFAGRWIAYT